MNSFPRHGPMPADGPPVVPAATVVIFRNRVDGGPPELLMVQRSKDMRFAGGAAVFPGGRIDPEDRQLADKLAPGDDPEVSAAKIAGIRETLEETGLMIATRQPVSVAQAAQARELVLRHNALEPVLEHFGWELDLGALTLFAHWCPDVERAFDTRFFVTDLGTGNVDITIDETEHTKLFWITAKDAIDQADSNAISIIFPTRRNLERLALFASFEEACDQIARYPVYRIRPVRREREGKTWLTIPDDQGYPVLEQSMDSVLRG